MVESPERVAAGLVGFVPAGVLTVTGKATLVAGSYAGRPAVAKVLTVTEPMWQARWDAELDIYRTFTVARPPVAVPDLLVADGARGVLVLSRLPGRPLAARRHLTRPLSATDTAAVSAALGRVGRWPAPLSLGPVFDYPDRITRYGPAGHGILTGRDLTRLNRLCDRLTGTVGWVFAHGDPLPSNILLDHRTVGLLDWEWAGRYLPGWDAAVLWTVLGADPAARRFLEGHQPPGPAADAFWLNTMLAVAREIRLQAGRPRSTDRSDRLASLGRDLATVRESVANGAS